MKEEKRQAALIRLWLESTRTLDHLIVFQGWLERNRPDLLHVDDVYQTLKSGLRPIRKQRRTYERRRTVALPSQPTEP
jgi:hypothetical protein